MVVQGVSILLLLLPFFGFCLRARATYNGADGNLAHATCYQSDATSMGGACGYNNVDALGYGENTAALSYALFNDGYTCGACYEIKCVNSSSCKPGIIKVTATNSCPSNLPGTPPWCNPPKEHFDLTVNMFKTIAVYEAGIVPVSYNRVPCERQGGIKFTFKPNLVLISNVGGVGDVRAVSVISSNERQLTKNWGQNWNINGVTQGQSIKFKVTTSDGKSVICNVAGWDFGTPYNSNTQF